MCRCGSTAAKVLSLVPDVVPARGGGSQKYCDWVPGMSCVLYTTRRLLTLIIYNKCFTFIDRWRRRRRSSRSGCCYRWGASTKCARGRVPSLECQRRCLSGWRLRHATAKWYDTTLRRVARYAIDRCTNIICAGPLSQTTCS